MLGRILVLISWSVTLLCTLVSAFLLLAAFNAEAAPAQGAAAALACGVSIVPYVFSRALEGLQSKE